MRYVVLEHRHVGHKHWDLLLEYPWSDLQSWRLEDPPGKPGLAWAKRMRPHRPVYLRYQGPVLSSSGSVLRWDQGNAQYLFESERCVRVRLNGKRLVGVIEFTRSFGVTDQDAWRLGYV